MVLFSWHQNRFLVIPALSQLLALVKTPAYRDYWPGWNRLLTQDTWACEEGKGGEEERRVTSCLSRSIG